MGVEYRPRFREVHFVENAAARLRCAALFSLVCVAAIGAWDDFVFLSIPALCVTTILGFQSVWHRHEGRRRAIVAALVATTGVITALALIALVATGRIRQVVSSLGARLPRELGGFNDPSFWLLLAVASAPLVGSLLLVLAVIGSKNWRASTRERAAWIRTAALAALFVALFATTRWTSIPFENTRLDFPDEVAAHLSAFWSNSLALDQDTLSWKMYFGVFGYPDVFYPAFIYTLGRWAVTALLIALPVLSWRFTQRNPDGSAVVLAVTGLVLAVCIVTNSIRYFQPSNPWGRYILPLFPLVALPVLARVIEDARDVEIARISLSILIGLHVWTSIVLLGSRYALGA